MKREEKTISEISKLKEDIEYLAHSFKVTENESFEYINFYIENKFFLFNFTYCKCYK